MIDYDLLVRRTLLTWHLGLITQAEKRDFIATIPRLMLQVFSFVNRFRTTGVTRADVRVNSPLAQTMALEWRRQVLNTQLSVVMFMLRRIQPLTTLV